MSTNKDPLVGRRITKVRYLTKGEMDDEGWYGHPGVALVLDDGTVIFPSADDEGNGPGALFGRTPDGNTVAYLPV